MHFQKMITIFKNTLNKEYRNKALIFIFVLTIGMILLLTSLMSYLQEQFIDADSMAMVSDKTMMVFFFCINAWTGFLGILLGAGCIRSDFNSGVISQILSFPIKRSEYIIARVAGTWAIVIFYYFISFILGTVLLSVSTESFVFNPIMLLAFLSSSLTILASILISILFSLYFSKIYTFISVGIVSMLISYTNNYFLERSFSDVFESFSVFKTIGLFIHNLLPRIGEVSAITNAIVLDNEFNTSPVVTFVHFGVTFAFLLIIVNWIFKKRDF